METDRALIPEAIHSKVPQVVALIRGLMVAWVLGGEDSFSMVSSPAILYSFGMLQLFSFEGVSGYKWSGKSERGMRRVLLDFS